MLIVIVVFSGQDFSTFVPLHDSVILSLRQIFGVRFLLEIGNRVLLVLLLEQYLPCEASVSFLTGFVLGTFAV